MGSVPHRMSPTRRPVPGARCRPFIAWPVAKTTLSIRADRPITGRPSGAHGRMPRWTAQWREMKLDPQTKIGRPREIYTGETARDYVPVDAR